MQKTATGFSRRKILAIESAMSRLAAAASLDIGLYCLSVAYGIKVHRLQRQKSCLGDPEDVKNLSR